jgi:hypothetical protein
MSKSPAAALSANLVAIKGAAVPAVGGVAPDMPARAAPPKAGAAEKEAALQPLNFRIPAAFRREFKTYAAGHDLKLNELLRRSFAAYRREQGD